MKEVIINIALDFNQYPAGRFKTDGPYSGEGFREKCLVPALKENDRVTVILDSVPGYGSSFLEEAFGGLIRTEGFSIDEITAKLHLKADGRNEVYIPEISTYIKEASESITHRPI